MKKVFLKKALALCLLSGVICGIISGCSVGKESDYKTESLNDSESSYASTELSNEGENSYFTSNDASDVNSQPVKKMINPFEGLEITYTGTAPYGIAAINTMKCSNEINENVIFTIDKETGLQNGDEIYVTATVNNLQSNEISDIFTYGLTETTKKYIVKDLPEYISSIDSLDTTQLINEMKDYYDSITAWKKGDYHEFGTERGYYVSSTNAKEYDSYYISLKNNKKDSISKDIPYNGLYVMFSIDLGNTDSEVYGFDSNVDNTVGITYKQYFAIYANNIIKYPDGHIGWGSSNPESLDFNYSINSNSLDDLINDKLVSKKAYYNIQKLPEKFGVL